MLKFFEPLKDSEYGQKIPQSQTADKPMARKDQHLILLVFKCYQNDTNTTVISYTPAYIFPILLYF